MTDEQANEQISALYWQFLAGQAQRGLRKAEARLKALPEVLLYPVETRIPSRKKAAVESVLSLCYELRPDLAKAKVLFFSDADAEDLAIWKRCQQQGIEFPYEHLLDGRNLSGLCDAKAGEIWIHAGLDDSALIDTTAHEFYHLASPEGSEADALAFGRKAASLLCPRGGLFFKEEHRYSAKAGDSILVPHGDRQWVRILGKDGSLAWHRPLEQFELFVSSGPNTYQA